MKPQSDLIEEQELSAAQAPLARAIQHWAPAEGVNATPLKALSCNRMSHPTSWTHVVYEPCMCVVAQGSKKAVVGERHFLYNPQQYLLLTLSLPLETQVLQAQPDVPFLSLVLKLDLGLVHDLLRQLDEYEMADCSASDHESGLSAPAIQVSEMKEDIGSCLLRLLSALHEPLERQVLAPMLLRELHYRLLLGEQGDLLRALAERDSSALKAQKVVRFLEQNYAESLDVGQIAMATNMSVSTLHHSFKQATALTPMQYLKRLRLHQARLLLSSESMLAANVAYAVGYSSVAQFSRDFKRQFGQTPSAFRKQIRAE